MSRNRAKHLLTGLIVLNLWIIWGSSLMTGADSGNLSGGILAWLGQFFPFIATEQGHHLLRKAAHFSEFALLGLLTGLRRIASGNAVTPGLTGWGLAAACIDETIQIYVPDRGSSLLDVWIDTAGFATGLALAFLGHRCVCVNQSRHTENNH